jgi:integrase
MMLSHGFFCNIYEPVGTDGVTMASIRRRTWKSGTKNKSAWIADYFDQHGKRHQVAFEKRSDAADELARIQVDVRQGTHSPISSSITVAEAAELWVEKGRLEGLERSTLKGYRNHVDLHIVPLLGSSNCQAVGTGHRGFPRQAIAKGFKTDGTEGADFA